MVTLVFTDLEGSSPLWEAFPSQMGRAVARHDEIVSQVVEKHEGLIFKSLGDGVCAVFRDVHDAVAATVELQLAVHREPWPEQTPLKVRVGIHTGEVETRCDDYFGHSVNLVARLVDSGHGGQTLLTKDTVNQLAGTASERIEFLGRYRFRGIKQAQEVYQLCPDGLRTEFPNLRGTEEMPNNLPEQLTSFVGRQREMAEIRELLRHTRLLTLTGMGGSGKTRLSLEIGSELLRSGESVYFVELAPVADERLVGDAIASALDVQVGSQPPLEAICSFLKDREMVVILDNCEQVVDASSRIVDHVLRRESGVRFLVSSRESLKVFGESIYQVPTLSVPSTSKRLSREIAEQFSAVQLFNERARAVAAHLLRLGKGGVELLECFPLSYIVRTACEDRHLRLGHWWPGFLQPAPGGAGRHRCHLPWRSGCRVLWPSVQSRPLEASPRGL